MNILQINSRFHLSCRLGWAVMNGELQRDWYNAANRRADSRTDGHWFQRRCYGTGVLAFMFAVCASRHSTHAPALLVMVMMATGAAAPLCLVYTYVLNTFKQLKQTDLQNFNNKIESTHLQYGVRVIDYGERAL